MCPFLWTVIAIALYELPGGSELPMYDLGILKIFLKLISTIFYYCWIDPISTWRSNTFYAIQGFG
jgi:hypothetical protein